MGNINFFPLYFQENIQTDETNQDIEKLKTHCEELHVEIERKNSVIVKVCRYALF